MNKQNLRKCLSLFATGVTSIVSFKKLTYTGITVNSFSSVSLNPPLVMWCIDKKSSSLKSFLSLKNNYKIIFLANSQKAISNKLAGSDNIFDKAFCDKIVKKSLGYLDCAIFKKYDAGDHYIIVHRVLKFKTFTKKKPLVFFDSKYKN